MNHQDHVNLIKDGIPPGGTWAELGSGNGAFTLALAECLGTDSLIYSVDIDQRALLAQETRMTAEYPLNEVEFVQGDFTRPLDLPPLDGVLMANSLHFVREKDVVIRQIRDVLKDSGRLIIVEYNTSQGNYAVPHPLTYDEWVKLAKACGFSRTELLATRPSRFLGEFFSAVSYY